MSEPATHSPWVLSLAIEIDEHCPGFCGEFFRASIERRQVFTAYLSAKPPTPVEMTEVGNFLLSADHRSILSCAYPDVPLGLRGALRRAGRAAHEHRFYSLLYLAQAIGGSMIVRVVLVRTIGVVVVGVGVLVMRVDLVNEANVLKKSVRRGRQPEGHERQRPD